jgi:hypothetical protein
VLVAAAAEPPAPAERRPEAPMTYERQQAVIAELREQTDRILRKRAGR